jgi:hypothetical protein
MRRNKWWLGIAGLLCLTAGCTNKLASKPEPSTAVPAEVEAQPESSATPDSFANPLVVGAAVQSNPIPNLIPLTSSAERVPQIDSGRPDPFASLGITPTVVKIRPAAASAPPPPASVVQVPASPPPPAVFPLPPLLPASTTLPPLAAGNLPTVSVPGISPVAPPRSAAESLEISGVVQVGGKTNVIIKAADEYTSRYAAVGERVANGKVLIKRVEMGLEPVVILEQAGREIVRSVGSGALVGSL